MTPKAKKEEIIFYSNCHFKNIKKKLKNKEKNDEKN